MIFLEKRKSSLTFAILLKDDLSPDKKASGDLFLSVPRIRKDIIRKTTGHFLLIDLPQVNQNIICGGEYYNQGSLTVDYKQGVLFVDGKRIDTENPVVSIVLSPKSNYPFPEGTTVLKGRLIDSENKPLSHVSISAIKTNLSAVSEDNGEYFIQFTALDTENTITLDIKKAGYKPVKQTVHLKKGIISQAGTVMLTKKA